MKFSLPHPSYGSRPLPSRDWGILLLTGILLLLATLAWHLWLFNRVVSGEALGQGAQVAAPTIHTDAIDSVQEVFGKRAAEESKYTSGAYHFIDPSK